MPNIPLLKAFDEIREMGWGKSTAAEVLESTGLGTPFINMTMESFLWGYKDELLCIHAKDGERCDFQGSEKSESIDDSWLDEDFLRKRRRRKADSKGVKNATCMCTFGVLKNWQTDPSGSSCQFDKISKQQMNQKYSYSKLGWWNLNHHCKENQQSQSGLLFPKSVKEDQILEFWMNSLCLR